MNIKLYLLRNVAARGIFAAVLVLVAVSLSAETGLAATYTSVQDGNWFSGSTWQGGVAPPSTIGVNDAVNIHHVVWYPNQSGSNPLTNNGRITVSSLNGSNAVLSVASQIDIINRSGNGTDNLGFFVTNAALLQCRFFLVNSSSEVLPDLCRNSDGTARDGQPYNGDNNGKDEKSGDFQNIGGYVQIINSDVEIAQDWTSINDGSRRARRLMINSCLRTGQNYSIKGDLNEDTLIGVNISIGWHNSGNFELAGTSSISFSMVKVQLAGLSGDFKLDSGTASGDIDLITLFNPYRTNQRGTGKIFASSSLNVAGGLNLDAHCTFVYEPNGRFIGTQTPNSCSHLNSDCETLVPSAAPAAIRGRVLTADGRGIPRAMIEIVGGDLEAPLRAITDSSGNYSIAEVPAGESYVISVAAKGYKFADGVRVLVLNDNLSGFDFVADPMMKAPRRTIVNKGERLSSPFGSPRK